MYHIKVLEANASGTLISGCGEVWYRAWFGTKRPRVQVPTLRPRKTADSEKNLPFFSVFCQRNHKNREVIFTSLFSLIHRHVFGDRIERAVEDLLFECQQDRSFALEHADRCSHWERLNAHPVAEKSSSTNSQSHLCFGWAQFARREIFYTWKKQKEAALRTVLQRTVFHFNRE